MADTKISALPAATVPLAGTEVLPIVQGGTTDKVSVADLTAGRAVSVNTLATTGNLALGGATFSAWTIYDPGTVEKTNGAFWASFTDQSRFGLNAYYAFQWVYKQNGFSSQYEQTSGSHKFYTAPSGTAGNPITYTQAFTIAQGGDVTVNTGNLVIGTSGKGIDFSATPGTGTSELLADYEEGTWTPELYFGPGDTTDFIYSVQIGRYTKIGNVVNAFARIVLTQKGSNAGSPGMLGLPFSSANVTNFSTGASPVNLTALPTGFFTLQPNQNATGPGSYVNGDIANNTAFSINFIYQTA
jgi:hypothetical protein